MAEVKVGEIWTFLVPLTNDNTKYKARPVLIISVNENFVHYQSINYVVISSSSVEEEFDVVINEEEATKIGLQSKSLIKTTNIYTENKTSLGSKIGDLPKGILDKFKRNYKVFQDYIISNLK
ncbi:MAG: PemK-like, MazF-like toxin of type toxin-antitoxin system [Haloplasmataceae bacterium]|nr:PemK-like, MazF-like toxin of type toxin-antitoxin system [Haloplasmataceae bacterium]